MNTLTEEQKTMIDRIIGDGLDDYSATRRSYSEVRTTMFNGVLDIINPPQKVEPTTKTFNVYQREGGLPFLYDGILVGPRIVSGGEALQNPIPFETFKRPTCKGSFELGSACGSCEKCQWIGANQ